MATSKWFSTSQKWDQILTVQELLCRSPSAVNSINGPLLEENHTVLSLHCCGNCSLSTCPLMCGNRYEQVLRVSLSSFFFYSSFLPFTLHAYTWATWLQSWLKYLMDIIHRWYSHNVFLIHFQTAKPSHFSRMPGLLNKESIWYLYYIFWGHISLFLLSFWLQF